MTNATDPAKYTLKYTMEFGSTDSGVPINTRIWGANIIPTAVRIQPDTRPNAIFGMYCLFSNRHNPPRRNILSNDSGTDCDSVEKSDHQKDQTAGRTDGCKCITAKKITDDQGIGGIV